MLLSKSFYLVHFNSAKQLYINLNVFKVFDFNVITYHIKKIQINVKVYSVKFSIQSIIFLSRLLKSTETRYWSMKLELVDMIWMIWKMQHLIELSSLVMIIYTDHEINVNIVKQISILITLIKKQNLHLVHVNKYL